MQVQFCAFNEFTVQPERVNITVVNLNVEEVLRELTPVYCAHNNNERLQAKYFDGVAVVVEYINDHGDGCEQRITIAGILRILN